MDVPECPGCQRRDDEIAALKAEVAALTRKIDELLRRSPPPAPRPQERYPQAPAKKATGKKPGGQSGHPPHLKQLAPPGRVQQTFVFVPECCAKCHASLPQGSQPGDPPPTQFQVAELPAMAAEITEYQGQARVCPCCGATTRATIPAELCRTSVGPRYAATLSYLAGAHGVSKRGLEEISEAIFDAGLSLGTVSNLEQEMSAALAAPHAQAVEAVRQAPVKHVDETGWKEAGRKRWLWVAATADAAVFLIHRLRSPVPLLRLLGRTLVGIVCSDRWSAYTIYGLEQRQLCWAHLKRNFAKLAERGGTAKLIGEAALDVQRQTFEAWHLFRGGGCTRRQLQDRIEPLEVEMVRILSRGAHGKDQKTARFCTRLYEVQEAMWTFAHVEGVGPTNNHGERVQRSAVLWRRRSFGCQSAEGCRFVERILTTVQTLRLQKRPVLAYLTAALDAHRTSQPAPQLVQMG
jgi:transposase